MEAARGDSAGQDDVGDVRLSFGDVNGDVDRVAGAIEEAGAVEVVDVEKGGGDFFSEFVGFTQRCCCFDWYGCAHGGDEGGWGFGVNERSNLGYEIIEGDEFGDRVSVGWGEGENV